MLVVILHITLSQVSKGKANSAILLKDFDSDVKEGFYKASHSGALTQEYGKYLGDDI
jgi:hypothetical protein